MGRDVKDFVETTPELYLNGSVDKAYEVATMDEKINHYFENIRDLATEEIRKNPDAMSQVVITSKWFHTWSVSVTMQKISVNGVVYFETGKIVEL